MSQGEIKR